MFGRILRHIAQHSARRFICCTIQVFERSKSKSLRNQLIVQCWRLRRADGCWSDFRFDAIDISPLFVSQSRLYKRSRLLFNEKSTLTERIRISLEQRTVRSMIRVHKRFSILLLTRVRQIVIILKSSSASEDSGILYQAVAFDFI